MVDGGDDGGNGGVGLEELREVVRNRGAWRMLTMTVARIQRIDGTRLQFEKLDYQLIGRHLTAASSSTAESAELSSSVKKQTNPSVDS